LIFCPVVRRPVRSRALASCRRSGLLSCVPEAAAGLI
jgi:hypothetical protein